MTQNSQHYSKKHFPTVDGKLCVQQTSLESMLEENEGEPIYVYSKVCITDTISTLRKHLPEEVKLLYSVKANPWQPIIQAIGALVDGFDTASEGELKTVIASSQPTSLRIMTGPGKSDHDLKSAITSNTIINIESRREFERVSTLASSQRTQVRTMLRLNPDLQLRTSGMKMSGGAKPFGVDIEHANELILDILRSELDFQGVHLFCGSQCLDSNAIMTTHRLLFEQLKQLQQEVDTQFKIINLGGGFGIPYFEQDQPLQVPAIGDHLCQLLHKRQKDFAGTTFVMEMGRFLIGPAGIYACRVIDIKESRGTKFVITNGGMHQHLAASGNLGQVIRKNYPIYNASRIAGDYEKVTIVGPLCSPLDILAKDVLLAPPELGDTIAIMQSGAYGLTASPQQFLSHPVCRQRLV